MLLKVSRLQLSEVVSIETLKIIPLFKEDRLHLNVKLAKIPFIIMYLKFKVELSSPRTGILSLIRFDSGQE